MSNIGPRYFIGSGFYKSNHKSLDMNVSHRARVGLCYREMIIKRQDGEYIAAAAGGGLGNAVNGLRLCDMTEEEQLQWAMTESVKSSSHAADILPLTSDGVLQFYLVSILVVTILLLHFAICISGRTPCFCSRHIYYLEFILVYFNVLLFVFN